MDQLTFSTERKYMATVVKSPLLGKKVLYVKGAPEIVLANSQRVAIDNTYKPVDACKADIETTAGLSESGNAHTRFCLSDY